MFNSDDVVCNTLLFPLLIIILNRITHRAIIIPHHYIDYSSPDFNRCSLTMVLKLFILPPYNG